ncbi:hypothetical protein D4764_04G0005090 [Takifugu flavidus]|uniref:Uncharacterized protein n=1 Tax=Takifugu flavidus TaxID=433684 RepID=A0A5C6N2Y2_9TELE|nr:hypothetical protein D4764_04G0005090 [Takifugu flavidus]
MFVARRNNWHQRPCVNSLMLLHQQWREGTWSTPTRCPPASLGICEYDFGPGHLEKIMEKKDHTNTKGGWKKKMGSSKKKDWIGLN